MMDQLTKLQMLANQSTWAINISCTQCGDVQPLIEVTGGQMLAWRNGLKIQEVFPELSPDKRELITSGICKSCFEGIW